MPGEGQTIGIIRLGPQNRVGDTAEALSKASVHHEIEDVLLDHGAGSTDTDRRSTSTVTVTAYCPAGEDVLDTDRVKLPDGTICRVQGRVENWEYGDWEPGLVVPLRSVR